MTPIAGPVADLIDESLIRYHEWRDHADEAAEAYREWTSAPRTERPLRFAACQAALDQEEQAARVYASALVELERWSVGAGSGRGRIIQIM
jgi:hypothetical protein